MFAMEEYGMTCCVCPCVFGNLYTREIIHVCEKAGRGRMKENQDTKSIRNRQR